MGQYLVVGASGVLGSHVADVLDERGHDVRRTSRKLRDGWTQLDLRDPGSVAKACHGVECIVHCGADPFGNARTVEVGGLSRLREAAPDARLVYPSIVGCDKIAFSYYRVKHAAEKALAAVGGDHAILRLTQFHEFVDRLARLPIPLSFAGMRAQTIAAREAAEALVGVAEGDEQGLVGDAGGPETHPMADLIKDRLRADGRRRPILRLPMGYRGFRAGYNLCPDDKVGKVTWEEHLAGAR